MHDNITVLAITINNDFLDLWQSLLLNEHRKHICDALRDSIPFVQFKKRENTHGGVLIFVKLQGKSLQLC